MDKKQKYAFIAIFSYFSFIALLVYIMVTLGVLSKDKIVVAQLATTGPDFEVVIGQLKLNFQLPDTENRTDVSGVMLTTNSYTAYIDAYFDKNNSWKYYDYYILTGKVVGLKQSDSIAFHPLFDVTEINHIDKMMFLIIVILDGVCFYLFRLFYLKFKLI